jgi:hypothetical protein
VYRYTHPWPRPRPRAPIHLPSTTMYRHIVLRVVNAVCVVRVLVGFIIPVRTCDPTIGIGQSIDRSMSIDRGARPIGPSVARIRRRHRHRRAIATRGHTTVVHAHAHTSYTYILLNPPKCSLLPPNTPHCAPPRYAESTRLRAVKDDERYAAGYGAIEWGLRIALSVDSRECAKRGVRD